MPTNKKSYTWKIPRMSSLEIRIQIAVSRHEAKFGISPTEVCLPVTWIPAGTYDSVQAGNYSIEGVTILLDFNLHGNNVKTVHYVQSLF
jgi:hypothetical protein